MATTIGGLSAVLTLAGISLPASAADPIHSITVRRTRASSWSRA